MDINIRKYYTFVEEIKYDGGKEIEGKVHKKVSIGVVFENPYTEEYVEDLSALADFSESITPDLVKRALKASAMEKEEIESYGKAAIIGTMGELEHGAALLHPKLGKPFRQQVNGGKAIIPSTKKNGLSRMCNRCPPAL